ncbi:hypothetical protein BH23CHL4_BH23CHL4_22080 [soil metagenome]
MTAGPTKHELLQIIDEERNYWTALIAQIDPARMTGEVVEGDWDVHDLVSHLVVWRYRTMGIVAAQTLGLEEPEDPWPGELSEDLDAINAWIDQRGTDEPTATLIDRYTASFADLRDLVDRQDAAQLHDPDRAPLLEGMSVAEAVGSRRLFDHLHEEHEHAVQAFIARGT